MKQLHIKLNKNTAKTVLTESRTDNEAILRILTQSNPADKNNPKYEYYKKLADWGNKRQSQDLANITPDTAACKELISKNKLTNRYNTLGALLNRLRDLMAQEGKYGANSALSNLIQKATEEILVSLSKIAKAPEQEEPEVSKGTDWTAEKAKRLANAKNTGETTSEVLDKFYEDYYKIEYAGLKSGSENDNSGIVDKLKSLDKVLIIEFNKLGYNPEVNPFAQFLKILIKEKRSIFNKLNTFLNCFHI